MMLSLAGCQSPGRVERADEPRAMATLADGAEVWYAGDPWRPVRAPSTQGALSKLLFGPAKNPRALWRHPQGIAANADGLLVCDQGVPTVVGVDGASGRRRTWAAADHAPLCPVSIAAAADGMVFVADTTWRAVLQYDAAGRWVRTLDPEADDATAELTVDSASADRTGGTPVLRPEEPLTSCAAPFTGETPVPHPDAGEVPIPRSDTSGTLRAYPDAGGRVGGLDRYRPVAVAVGDGVLWIGDAGAGVLRRYDVADQKWLEAWQPPAEAGRLVAPTGLLAVADGVVVADSVRGQVWHAAGTGDWRPIGRPGRGPGEWVRPKQAALTGAGRLFVTDAGRQSVLVWSLADRQFLGELFGPAGEWPGWTLPAGVAALSAEDVPGWAERWTGPSVSERVIVSDALGPQGLTLLVVVEPGQARSADDN